jgi:(1->4)-alpha-D-glucan 1-alpha-D-glucosylmutase
MRFQQTTSPVTAKGIEDTALYLYNRLVSLNEVGGEPDRFGVAPERLHEWLAARQRDWPHALSATSTHDTKRSEDVRARISVLSEIPGEWRVAVGRWSRFNKRHRTLVDGVPAPDRNEEYLLYQVLLGTWPMDALRGTPDGGYVERICAYMVKALREGKRHSSWLNPSAAWEDAATGFVRRVLDPATAPQFLDEFQPLALRVAHAGMWNSLAQTLIKITAPGVPDFYQGTEVWDLSLVDPDNRRPVDYAARRAALDGLGGDDLGAADVDALLESRVDGRIKLYTIAAALRCRRRNADLFKTGDYVPIAIAGRRATHAFAFARIAGARATLTLVPRLTATLVPTPADAPIGRRVWDDTHLLLPAVLREVTWVNEITRQTLERTAGQETLRLADVLERFPVAVLTSSEA